MKNESKIFRLNMIEYPNHISQKIVRKQFRKKYFRKIESKS